MTFVITVEKLKFYGKANEKFLSDNPPNSVAFFIFIFGEW